MFSHYEQLFIIEMEKIELSLKEMKEIDSSLRSQPANAWVKSKLTDIQSQWDKLSKQVSSWYYYSCIFISVIVLK